FRVTSGFYAGHPNPTRANRANTFNPQNPQSPVPSADPLEGYQIPLNSSSGLTTFGNSTDGLTEYTAANFNGAMQGDLLAASFDNSIHDIKLDSTGAIVISSTTLFSNVGSVPLDVTVGTGSLAGTIWVADYQLGTIIVYEPNDFSGSGAGGTGADDPSLDDDGNHFSNHDEIVTGPNPLSAADTPHDWNNNYLSDRLDPNDDSDT